MKNIIILLALLGLTACYSPLDPTRPQGQLVQVQITGSSGNTSPGSARTIYPQVAEIVASVTRYEVVFSGPPDVTVPVELVNVTWNVNNYNMNIMGVPTGAYTNVTVKALNVSNKVILQGYSGPITVTNSTNNLNVNLSPAQSSAGSGSVSLVFDWPIGLQSTGVTTLDLQLVSKAGVDPVPVDPYYNKVFDVVANASWTPTVGTNTKTFDLPSLPSGDYRIWVHVDGYPLELIETIAVYDDTLNKLNWTFTSGDFGHVPLTPGADMRRPLWEKNPTTPGIKFFWSKDGGYKTGTRIYRSTDGFATETLVGTVPGTDTSYVDTTISLDTNYGYKLVPYTLAGESVPLFLNDEQIAYRSTSATLFVSSAGSDLTSIDGITLPVRTLSRALQLAQDGDTVKLEGGAVSTEIDYAGYAYLDKRVHISGGWDNSFTSATPQTLVSRIPQGLEVDHATFDGGFTAEISGLTISAVIPAKFAMEIYGSYLITNNLTIIPPVNHPVGGGGIYAQGPGYQLTFNSLKVEYPTGTFTDRSYITSDGASLSIDNAQFLCSPSVLSTSGRFRGIDSTGDGSLVMTNSIMDVGTDNTSYDSFGVMSYPTGSSGMVKIANNRFFLRGADANVGTTDYAILLSGPGVHKPQVTHNYFQFSNGSNVSPVTGIWVDGADTNALIFNNVFVTSGDSFSATGIWDRSPNTRILNNTFSSSVVTGGTSSWTGVDIGPNAHPRLINNLFLGQVSSLAQGLGRGVNVDATTNPEVVLNNGFIGFLEASAGYAWVQGGSVAAVDLNTEAVMNGGGTPGTVAGNFYYDFSAIPDNITNPDRPGVYGVSAATVPRIRFGGRNLADEIAAWGGIGPILDDIETDTLPAARGANYGGAADNPWSVGADENMNSVGDWMRYSQWSFTAGVVQDDNSLYDNGAPLVNPDAWAFADYSRKDRQETVGGAMLFLGNNFSINAGKPFPTPPLSKFDAGWSVSLFYGDVVYKKGKMQTFFGNADSETTGWYAALDTNGPAPKLRIQANGIFAEAVLPFWTLHRKWNHLVVVYDRSLNMIRAYLNGSMTPLIDFAVADNLDFQFNAGFDFKIGAKGALAAGSDFFYGKIDDVQIFNRPVGPGELSALMGAGDFTPNYTSTVGTWNQTAATTPYTRLDLSWSTVPDNFGFLVKWKEPTSGIAGYRLLPPEAFGGTSASLKGLPPGSYDLSFSPLNATWGNLNDTVQLTATKVLPADPDSSLMGLWTFGDNEGKNLMAPLDGLQAFTGNNDSEWWSPDKTSHVSTTGIPDPSNFWQNDRINPGSVYFNNSTYLQSGMVPGLDPDGASSYTVHVRFALAAPLTPGLQQTLFQVGQDDGIPAFALRLAADGTKDYLALYTSGGANSSLSSVFNTSRLQVGKYYDLMVNYKPLANTYDYYFSDGVSPSYDQALIWDAAKLRQQLKLGFSSAGNFKGWIDEVRVYKNKTTVDFAFFNSLVSE